MFISTLVIACKAIFLRLFFLGGTGKIHLFSPRAFRCVQRPQTVQSGNAEINHQKIRTLPREVWGSSFGTMVRFI